MGTWGGADIGEAGFWLDGMRLGQTALCRMEGPVSWVCRVWVLPASDRETTGLKSDQLGPEQRAPVCGESPWLKMRTEDIRGLDPT